MSLRSVSFTVQGIAVPQGDLKAFMPKGGRFPVLTHANPNLKGWRQLVATVAQQHITTLFTGPVLLYVVFWLARPKALAKKGPVPHLTRPDLDKTTRGILDALQGVAYRDDSQVVRIEAAKEYAPVDTPPFVSITIAEQLVVPSPVPKRPGMPLLPLEPEVQTSGV